MFIGWIDERTIVEKHGAETISVDTNHLINLLLIIKEKFTVKNKEILDELELGNISMKYIILCSCMKA